MNRVAQEANTYVVQALIEFPAFRLAAHHVGQKVNFIQIHLLAENLDRSVGVSNGGGIVFHDDKSPLASC